MIDEHPLTAALITAGATEMDIDFVLRNPDIAVNVATYIKTLRNAISRAPKTPGQRRTRSLPSVEQIRSAAKELRAEGQPVSSRTMADKLGYKNRRSFAATINKYPDLKSAYLQEAAFDSED